MRHVKTKIVADLILTKLGETYNRVHSDQELIKAINHVVHYMNLICIRLDSPFFQKTVAIKKKEHGVELPDDYVRLCRFESEDNPDLINRGTANTDEGSSTQYKLLGDKIYVSRDDTMIYYYHVRPLLTLGSNEYLLDKYIDMPYFLMWSLVDLAAGYLEGVMNDAAIQDAITAEVQSAMNESKETHRRIAFKIM